MSEAVSKRLDAPSPEVLAAAVQAWSLDGRQDVIRVSGQSMLPTIQEGDRLLVRWGERGLRRGDVAIFWQARQLVAHRVLRVERDPAGTRVLTRGDNAYRPDPVLAGDQVLGRAVALERGGRRRALDRGPWRTFGWLVATCQLYGGRLSHRLLRGWSKLGERGRWARTNGGQLLCACAHQQLGEAERKAASELYRGQALPWDQVYAAADWHQIAPLVYVNLERCAGAAPVIPAPILARFKLAAYRNADAKERMADRIERLLQITDGRGIPVMLLKGAALDVQIYEQPWYTLAGDVDVVFRTPPGTIADHDLAPVMDPWPGFMLEWECQTHHDVTLDGALTVDFEGIWARATQAGFRGHAVYLMAPPDLLVTLCISTCRRGFRRLRQLCDIAETVEKYPELDWAEVMAIARAWDCRAIVYAGLLMARLALGSQVPEAALAGLAIGPVQRGILRYLARRVAAPGRVLWLGPGHRLNAGAALSYASYTPGQVWRRLLHAWVFGPHKSRQR